MLDLCGDGNTACWWGLHLPTASFYNDHVQLAGASTAPQHAGAQRRTVHRPQRTLHRRDRATHREPAIGPSRSRLQT